MKKKTNLQFSQNENLLVRLFLKNEVELVYLTYLFSGYVVGLLGEVM